MNFFCLILVIFSLPNYTYNKISEDFCLWSHEPPITSIFITRTRRLSSNACVVHVAYVGRNRRS